MEKTVHLLIMYTMLVLTLLLFHKGRKHPRSLMLALYASVEVVTNGLNSLTLSAGWTFFDRFPFSHFIYKPIYCLWVPLFYFYFRSVLSADFRISKQHWPHFLPAGLFFVFFSSILIFKGNHYIWENLYRKNSFVFNLNQAVDVGVKIQYIFYIFLMFRSLLQIEKVLRSKTAGIQAAEVDIRWLRFIVYGYAAGAFSAITIFVASLMNSPATSTINIVSISYYFLFFFAIFYNTITQKSFESEGKSKGSAVPDQEMHRLMEIVDEIVRDRKMYLVPDLNLQQLAQSLNESSRNISQAINAIKKQNVNEYINSLRIEHACQLLRANKEKPVFEVMYESGFSTKASFNLTFKKITGKTPTQYRDRL